MDDRCKDASPNIGQRCFFQIEHICSFGNVKKIENEGHNLLIQSDNGKYYEINISDVILL